MGRDERVVEDRYNEQDPAAGRRASSLDGDRDVRLRSSTASTTAGWERTGVYNYPEPTLRTVEWIAIHTTHELLHHRGRSALAVSRT